MDHQYNSAIDTFSTCAKKGCSFNSGRVYRSRGSFSRQIKIKSLASSDILVAFENFISSSIYLSEILQSSQSRFQWLFRKVLFQTTVRMSKLPRSTHQFCCYKFFFSVILEKHTEVSRKMFLSWCSCWLTIQNRIA